MLRKVAVFAPLLGLMVFASGCCSVGPCGTGMSCDPCGATCGDTCDDSCGDCGDCGTCSTVCSTQCCFPNPLHWVGGLFHKASCCDSGCGELYWGGWHNYPPTCDPCGRCGEWIGDEGVGCYEGCGCNQGCSTSGGSCADCQGNAAMPEGVEIISRADQRMSAPHKPNNPAPNRVPTKAAPKPVKKSPQARRPYYGLPRR